MKVLLNQTGGMQQNRLSHKVVKLFHFLVTRQLLSALSICLGTLVAHIANTMDPDQTAPFGAG